jgi:hypothetical protein
MVRSCSHFETAMYLVACRTQKLSEAGAAVGLFDREELDYGAGSGIAGSLVNQDDPRRPARGSAKQ